MSEPSKIAYQTAATIRSAMIDSSWADTELHRWVAERVDEARRSAYVAGIDEGIGWLDIKHADDELERAWQKFKVR